MKSYRNILVVLDASGFNRNALEKALFLGKIIPGCKITLFLPVFDFAEELTLIGDFTQKEEILRGVIEARQKEVDDAISEVCPDAQNIASKVVWSRSTAESTLNEISEGQYDLVLKPAGDDADNLDNILFTPDDWQITRKSQVPVTLIQGREWKKGGNIVVATTFTGNDINNKINLKLLREAQMLAKLTEANIHLVNVVPTPAMQMNADVPGFIPDTYHKALHEDHRRKLTAFAFAHRIPLENTHAITGLPDMVIPDLAKRLDADLVILGTAGRDGLAGALIGNTAEIVVSELQCDVLMLKVAV